MAKAFWSWSQRWWSQIGKRLAIVVLIFSVNVQWKTCCCISLNFVCAQNIINAHANLQERWSNQLLFFYVHSRIPWHLLGMMKYCQPVESKKIYDVLENTRRLLFTLYIPLYSPKICIQGIKRWERFKRSQRFVRSLDVHVCALARKSGKNIVGHVFSVVMIDHYICYTWNLSSGKHVPLLDFIIMSTSKHCSKRITKLLCATMVHSPCFLTSPVSDPAFGALQFALARQWWIMMHRSYTPGS